MTDYKQLCAELLAALESWSPNGGAPLEEGAEAIAEARLIERARAALSQPEPDVDDILQLAAIIRKVDGNNSLGAAALAEEILSHPHSRWTADRAQRQPVPVTEGPTDEEIMGLMPQQMHKDLATAARAMAEQTGANSTRVKGAMRIILNQHTADLARAALFRRGRHAPLPVPVSEQPWEREGWCDEQGRCWALNEHLPAWEFHDCADSRKWADLFLPAHALPLPGEVES